MFSHRTILVSIALVIAAMVFACVVRVRESSPEAELSRIRPGMSETEVRRIMGRGPDWWGNAEKFCQAVWLFRDGRTLVATFDYGRSVDPQGITRVEVNPHRLRAVEIRSGIGRFGEALIGSWRSHRSPMPEGQPGIVQQILDSLEIP